MVLSTSEETEAKVDEPNAEMDDRLLGSRRLAAVTKVNKGQRFLLNQNIFIDE